MFYMFILEKKRDLVIFLFWFFSKIILVSINRLALNRSERVLQINIYSFFLQNNNELFFLLL